VARRLSGPAQDEGDASPLFDDGADVAAFQQGLEVVLDIVHVQPEPAGRQPVDLDLHVLDAIVLQGEGVLGARYPLDPGLDLRGQAVQGVQVGAIDLDRQVAAHAGQHLGDAHVDGLGEGKAHAGKVGHDGAQLVGQPGRIRVTPGVAWLQHHEGVGLVQAHGVQAQFVGTGAGDDGLDLRYLLQDGLLHPAVDDQGLVEADGGQLFQLHDEVALIHGRHEALAEQHEGAAARQQGEEADGDEDPAVGEGGRQDRS
jgi:hypothetical protein